MFKTGSNKLNFVCVNDITHKMEPMDSVIYNPNRDKEESITCLKSIIRSRFKVDLTDEQLERLTSYDKDHLYDFIKDLKDIIENKK